MARKSRLPQDFGKRVRAARAYHHDMSRKDFADELDTAGAGAGTIKGWETQEKRPPPLAEDALIDRLVEVTQLPRVFFTSDLAALGENVAGSVEARLAAIEKGIAAQSRALDELLTRRADFAADVAGLTPEQANELFDQLRRWAELLNPSSAAN